MQNFHAPAGHSLAFDVAGSGSPVLLIMGFATPSSAWSHQIAGLRDRHQVIWFDNRGINASTGPVGPWQMADFADDAVALLDHLGHRRAHVVGQSMGGMIAQHVALRAPERVDSLALLATHPGGKSARRPPPRAWPLLLGRALPVAAWRLRAMAHLLFPASYLRNGGLANIAQELQRDYGPRQPVATLRRQLGAMRNHDVIDHLAALRDMPVLIARPDQDILVDPCHSDRMLLAMPHAQLVRLADAGHGAIRQCAQEINQALLAHFATADDQRNKHASP